MADEDTLASKDDGLAEAIASIPKEEPEATQAPEPPEGEKSEDQGQPRDEHGRFAPKGQDDPQDEVPGGPAEEPEREGGQIPSWRLREIREERDRIAAAHEQDRRELEQLRQYVAQQQRQAWEAQQAQQFDDPNAYHQYTMSLIDQRLQAVEQKRVNDRVNWSCHAAHEKYGEAFDKVFQLLETHPERDRLVAEMVTPAVSPGEAIWKWGKKQQAMQEVGDDLEGYHKRLREQWKKDPEFRKEFMADLDAEARGTSARSSETNVTNLPSVNRAPGGGARQTMGELGQTDGEIFANLTRKRSR